MKFQLPKEVQELVSLTAKALIDLDLKEKVEITESEAKQYSKDYSPSTKIWGKQGDIKSVQYPEQSLKIVDYCIFIMPKLIFGVIINADNDTGMLTLANSVNKTLEVNGANGMARYLGNNFVPRYVDHKKLYQKVMWLEWLLTHTLRLVEEGKIIDFYIPVVGGPKTQLTFRFNATKSFLDTYRDKHLEVAQELAMFRESYKTKTLNESFVDAMRVLLPSYAISIEVSNATSGNSTNTILSLTEEIKSDNQILNVVQETSNSHDGNINKIAASIPLSTDMNTSLPGKEKSMPHVQEPTNNNSQDAETDEDNFEDCEDEEFFEAKEWNETIIIQPEEKQNIDGSHSSRDKKDDIQSESNAAIQELTLKDLQKSVLSSISDWVTKTHATKSTALYNLKRDKDRARDLIAVFSDAANINDLKDKLVQFIITGQTITDKTSSTFSRFDIKNSLCRHLAEQFCPATCKHTKTGWLGRAVLADRREKINNMLDFSATKTDMKKINVL